MKTVTTRITYGKSRHSGIKRAFRAVGIVLAVVLAAAAGLVGVLTLTEYRPADTVELALFGEAERTLSPGETFTVLTWNVGYGALGDNADFFMDGGTMVRSASRERVEENLEGILAEIRALSPDAVFLQEVDADSSRSYRVNELSFFQEGLDGFVSSYAQNFRVLFLPYPVPPIGRVDAGIATFTAFSPSSAERIQLPVPFSWPVRTVNLKRCLLVTRIPVEGDDRELVLVNLHLEAYDDGEGKLAQTRMLAEFLNAEAEAGNWVVAGGDFNQIFSTADGSAYPAQPGMWAAGTLDASLFGDGWRFRMDGRVPSCRSLDRPYAGADRETFQYYLIDGFIVSENLTAEAFETRDLGFVSSDHNPVLLRLTLN